MKYCRYCGKILFNQLIYHTNAFTHHEKQSVGGFNINTLYKALRMLICIFSPVLFVRLPVLRVCFFDILTYLFCLDELIQLVRCKQIIVKSPCKYCPLPFVNE